MRKAPVVLLVAMSVVLVAVVHVAVEGWLELHLKDKVPVDFISYGIAAALGVIFIVLAEWITDELYGASALVRYAHHKIAAEPYVEGWWLDVGIDDRGGIAQIKDCSFITIVHDQEEELHVEGLTWETQSQKVFHWHSVYTRMVKRTLYFGYEYTTTQDGASSERGNQVARYNFLLDGNSFDGGFDGDCYKAIGRLRKRNLALSPRLRDLPEAERKRLAQENMHQFMQASGYDLATYRQISTRRGLDRKEWFLTFVKATDRKKAERDLLNRLFDSVNWQRPMRRVLDLGPADGVLTVEALNLSGPLLRDAQYLGIDLNGASLDELAEKLQRECQRAEDARTMLHRQSIETFLASDEANFDLIMVFHSLYFVQDLPSALPRLWAKLAPSGRLLEMHSDFRAGDVVSGLLTQFNPTINREASALLNQTAQKAGVTRMTRVEGEVKLEFPELTGEEWERTRRNGASEKVSQVIALLAFLMDRGPSDLSPHHWQQAVDRLRTHLATNHNLVRLPLAAHVFERA